MQKLRLIVCDMISVPFCAPTPLFFCLPEDRKDIRIVKYQTLSDLFKKLLKSINKTNTQVQILERQIMSPCTFFLFFSFLKRREKNTS